MREELGIEGGFCKGIRIVVKGKTSEFSKDIKLATKVLFVSTPNLSLMIATVSPNTTV